MLLRSTRRRESGTELQERVAAMIMVMAGQGGHGWARFRTRLSLSDFSRVNIRAQKKSEKRRREPGNEANAHSSPCYGLHSWIDPI